MSKSERRTKWTRRHFAKAGLAAAGALVALPVLGRVRPRVVIVGAGVAGTIVARDLVAKFPELQVTLIEAQASYLTPFFANRSFAGLAPLESYIYRYDRIAQDGRLRFLKDRVTDIDRDRKSVRLASGATEPYDKLIVATGIDMAPAGIENYDAQVAETMPHAYVGNADRQWHLLNAQLSSMEDGGVVAVVVPERPYRCHPAPYERVSLMAGYLQGHKPRSKILVLDANSSFPLMGPMQAFWEKKFGAMVEWLPGDFGGRVKAVDPKNHSLITEDGKITPTVANVIPPQQAPDLAKRGGLVGKIGWCPVDPVTFQSVMANDVYVLGDAIDPGDMPRSAFAAASQAKVCAVAIGNALTGQNQPSPELTNACYFLLEKNHGLVVGGAYKPVAGRITGVKGFASEAGEDASIRAKTAANADAWYKDITREMFGV